MTSGVYKITNMESGKIYIGSSINIEGRWATHRCDLSRGDHHSPHLQRAWNLYGPDVFKWEILEECDPADRAALEQQYLDTLHPWDSKIGYNNARETSNSNPSEETRAKMSKNNSGSGNPRYGKKLTEEHKQKLKEANIGRRLSEEAKARISAANKGRANPNKGKSLPPELIKRGADHHSFGTHPSEEARKKMSESRKGRKAWNEGIPTSDEVKRKLSEINSGEGNGFFGKSHSAESKQKMSNSHKGVTRTEEARRKQSETCRLKREARLRAQKGDTDETPAT